MRIGRPRVNKRYQQDFVIDNAMRERKNLTDSLRRYAARMEQLEIEIKRLMFPPPRNQIVPDIWKSARGFE